MPYLSDIMRRSQTFFRVDELAHGNKKKTDRVVWSLQGRFENGYVTLNKGDWNNEFLDQLFQFPNKLVHDDLRDALVIVYRTTWQRYPMSLTLKKTIGNLWTQ